MLEPQSTVFLVLLVVVFGALMWWLIVSRQMVLRIIAACLAFIPAMAFGVAAVNKYYDYYQTWGAAIADVTNQGVPAPTGPVTVSKPSTGSSLLVGRYVDIALARQQGYILPLKVHGRSSDMTRTVYVFLPPQYFWPGYQRYRFPAIELMPGFPGTPQDWITVLGVNSMLDTLVSQHRARPAVLVMPDANGGRGISLQCLNQVRGPQDANFLARDLPAYIAGGLRVQRPGAGWGIAGYSEGGFCAANLGLQYGRVYSYAGVLSGYFRPVDNQLAKPSRQVNPFGSNRRMKFLNTPLDLLRSLPVGRAIPRFWLGHRLDMGRGLEFSPGLHALFRQWPVSAWCAPPQFGLIRLRNGPRPSPVSSVSPLGRPAIASSSDRPGPETSGPAPCDQSISVAVSFSPATRCLLPSGKPAPEYIVRHAVTASGCTSAVMPRGRRMSSLWTTISPSMVTTGAGGRLVVVVLARSRLMMSPGGSVPRSRATRSIIVLKRKPAAARSLTKAGPVCSAPATT